jgi:hypothetical protein
MAEGNEVKPASLMSRTTKVPEMVGNLEANNAPTRNGEKVLASSRCVVSVDGIRSHHQISARTKKEALERQKRPTFRYDQFVQ